MGRNWQQRVKLASGETVGFSLFQRGRDPFYSVRFQDKTGRFLERSTGKSTQKAATDRAEELIAREYETAKPSSVTWFEVIEDMRERMITQGNKPRTIKGYLSDLDQVRKFYSSTTGPADITAPMAKTWLTAYTNRQYTKSTKVDAAKRSRSGHTVKARLNQISVIWSKWLIQELQVCSVNPWAELEPPRVDKPEVRVIDDDEISQFFAWLDKRFHGWQLPVTFFTVKMITGCRLLDLCSIKPTNLVNGQLVFPADISKGRKDRRVPLPLDLYDQLKSLTGKVWLWERQPTELRAALKKNGWPTHRLNPEFSPERLQAWLLTLLADYRADHPDREHFGSHAFRKRAFTRAWQAGIDPKRASIAYGCNVETMMRHYVQLDEQQTTDEVFAKMVPVLIPSLSPDKSPATPPIGDGESPTPS